MPVADETGSSALSSIFSVAIFLAFLLVASQALVHLYATSTVTAVAFDTARRASADGSACPPEHQIRARLGSWGNRAGVQTTCVRQPDGTTTVTISGPSPAQAFGGFAGAFGRSDPGGGLRIERGATFHTETSP
jgi:hypothetical protein